MLRLRKDTQTPKLLIKVFHILGNPSADSAKIMIFQLLTLGGVRAKQSAAG